MLPVLTFMLSKGEKSLARRTKPKILIRVVPVVVVAVVVAVVVVADPRTAENTKQIIMRPESERTDFLHVIRELGRQSLRRSH